MNNIKYYMDRFGHIPACTHKWVKPCEPKYKAIHPFNPITKITYQGNNAFDLYCPLWENSKLGCKIDLRFSTRKQINKAGGFVRNNAKPFYIRCFAGNGFKPCIVYNYCDVIFPNNKYAEYAPQDYEFNLNNVVERLFKKNNVEIICIADIQPTYVPHENVIYIPTHFKDNERKYECMLHELIHWTKYNSNGCDRGLSYAQEECVAEYGMLMLYKELFDTIPQNILENGLDYIASWVMSFPDKMRLDVVKDSVEYAYRAVSELLNFKD